jgi:predicted transcriptional regulator YheO
MSAKESNERVRSCLPLVDFLSEIAGPYSEVVLHDVCDRSLVAIRNGHLSGREVGEPMTDFAAYILRLGSHNGRDFITNYLGKAGSSGKFLKSSTFFIRDDDGEIVGMLGINTDLSALAQAHKVLGEFLAVNEAVSNGVDSDESEDSAPSIHEMVYTVVEQVLATRAADPSHMTTDEKKAVVDLLNERGVFLLKGTVAEVASRLEVSEQTIYRYLK